MTIRKRTVLFVILTASVLLAQNIQWRQLASGSRHGSAGTKGQSSDGTGTNTHGACYNSTGDLTDCGTVPGGGSVTSITAGSCLQGGTITTSGSISSIGSCYIAGGGTANAQTATYSPAIGSLVAGLQLCWLPSNANTTTTPTFSPNSLTAKTIIKAGGSALVASDLTTTAVACVIYDGTSWELQNPQTGLAGTGTVTSIATNAPLGGGPITTTGTLTCTTCTVTIANGTSALGTSAISSGACASTVTTAASGVATTDDIIADFNASPLSTTGYSASASGMLTIIKWPTSGDVNFAVCNNTGSSITPGAVTLNWRVVR